MALFSRFAVSSVICLASCGTAWSADIEAFERPTISEEVEVSRGDVILEKGHRSTADGILVKSEVQFRSALDIFLPRANFVIPAGSYPKAYQDQTHTYFSVPQMIMTRDGDEPFAVRGGLCIKNDDKSSIAAFFDRFFCIRSLDEKPEIERRQVIVVRPEFFYQRLVYAGRTGSLVKLECGEISGDRARPPLLIDTQHDLRDGQEFTLKHARIQIIEATDERLTYRLLHGFEGADR